ncbi:unnamed protein product [Closterium sp. NIES-64]|nr:unnamed protein product [Closterium sp. NIES-64]
MSALLSSSLGEVSDLTLPLSFHLPLLFSALSFSTPLFPPPSPFLRSLLFHPSLSTSLSFSPLSPFPPLSISTSSPVHSSLLFTHTPRPYHHQDHINATLSAQDHINATLSAQDHINATLSAQVPSFESTPSPFRSPLPFTPHPHHHQDHINATLSAQDNINATLSAQQGHNEEAAEALEKAIRALMVDKPLPSLADAAARAAYVDKPLPSLADAAVRAAFDLLPPLLIDPTDPTAAIGHTAASSIANSVSASEDRFSPGFSVDEHAGCESFCATCIRPLNCSLVPSFPCSCCRRPDTPANVAALDGDSEDGGDGGVGDSSGGGRGVTITGAQGGSESCKEEARGGDSAGGGGGVGGGGERGGGGGGGEEGGEREARKPACVDGTAEGRWVNYTWWEADECEYR